MGNGTFRGQDELMYFLWVMMLLIISGWQSSSYPMPKSFYQQISHYMACDEFVLFSMRFVTLLVLT